MNNKYLKSRLFQSIFLALLFMGLSVTTFAQIDIGSSSESGSGSTSASDSNSNSGSGSDSCPCPCFSSGGSDSGSNSNSNSAGSIGSVGSASNSDSSSGGVNGDPCNCCVPDEVCPTPTINTPNSNLISAIGNFCQNAPVTFSAPDLGLFAC